MGASFVSKDGSLQAKSFAVYGSQSSFRPELTGIVVVMIVLACEDSPIDQRGSYHPHR